MSPQVYEGLRQWTEENPGFDWLRPLLDESEALLRSDRHGDLPQWRAALAALPKVTPHFDGGQAAPRLGSPVDDPERLRQTLMRLHPWRKGPLETGGVLIDAEWRSDRKWNRVSGAVRLEGHRVLDIGCGNGYFGWRMLAEGANCVIGLDPTLVFVLQWLACRHFAGDLPNFVLPLGVERLPNRLSCFDTVFSMGVLYHRRDPVDHLRHLGNLLSPGGQIVLETLVLDQGGEAELLPKSRYARMRNVWSIPTLPLLQRWLNRAGLPPARVLDVTATTVEEQRSTEWMTFESLDRCLDPQDPSRTVEGYPAPVRCAMLIRVRD